MRRAALTGIVGVLIAAGCTAGPSGSSATPSPPASSVSATASPSTSPTTSGPLVFGLPLPDGCDGGSADPSLTIALVAAGRAWAVSPDGELACLFRTRDPGPFVFGPQGDRVLLGDMRVRFLDDEPTADLDTPATDVFAFGRPIGRSIVWWTAEDGPRKRTFGESEDRTVPDMPEGAYADIAFHPSGLALAVSIDDPSEPSIHLVTNEGGRDNRIVIGVSATAFPSVDFTSDGRYLLYLADHKGGYSQLHMIDLDDPNELLNLWKSKVGTLADGLVLPPGIGDTLAFTLGTTCADRVAVWGSVNRVRPVLPDESRPTTAIGYLDPDRLLVGVRDCAEGTLDLVVATPGEPPVEVATGVSAAAARADGPDAPARLPEDVLGDLQEFG